MTKRAAIMKKRPGTKANPGFDILVAAIGVLIAVLVAYPLYFCIIASFSSPTEVATGNTMFWIKGFTLDHYGYVFRERSLWVGYRNTVIYTLLGTIYNLVLTIPAAYVLSKRELPFKNVLLWYFLITMYIGGGIIPQYFLIKNLGLLDSPLSLIVGTGVSASNLVITRSYFRNSIPGELYEATWIDGGSEFRTFLHVALPLSKPITAVMALYYGVTRWNSYYNALLFIRSDDFKPLQLVLREILVNNQISVLDMSTADTSSIAYMLERAQVAEGMKYAIVFIASAPLLIAFPFVQKHFTKGIMMGSVKG